MVIGIVAVELRIKSGGIVDVFQRIAPQPRFVIGKKGPGIYSIARIGEVHLSFEDMKTLIGKPGKIVYAVLFEADCFERCA
jgi:hypothetical protein